MRMKPLVGLALIISATLIVSAFAATDPLAPIDISLKQPVAAAKPVTETLFGTTVVDPYRYFERMGPDTLAWMTDQGRYTRAVFDAIAPRAALLKRISNFVGSFGVIADYQTFGGRAFYEERAPGADAFDLKVRDAHGTRTIIDIAAVSAQNGGIPYAINFFLASPDGSKVAAGISKGGSEDAALYAYDAATGKQIAGPIDRAQYGTTSWSDDSRTVFFIRLKKLATRQLANRSVQGRHPRCMESGLGTGSDPRFHGRTRPAVHTDRKSGAGDHARRERGGGACDQRRAERNCRLARTGR